MVHCLGLVPLFQHTAARRRLPPKQPLKTWHSKFQHTAARRRLFKSIQKKIPMYAFQHTAARRRLDKGLAYACGITLVSTHSRPKAAAEIVT